MTTQPHDNPDRADDQVEDGREDSHRDGPAQGEDDGHPGDVDVSHEGWPGESDESDGCDGPHDVGGGRVVSVEEPKGSDRHEEDDKQCGELSEESVSGIPVDGDHRWALWGVAAVAAVAAVCCGSIEFKASEVVIESVVFGVGLLLFFEHEVFDDEHVHIGGHEASKGLFGGADDRFAPDVEAGVDQHR